MASRFPASVLFVLQALLWGAGSILEARAAAESLTRYTHVEDTGNPTCPPIHSHLDCLVCRTFSSGAGGGPPLCLDQLDSEAAVPRLQVDDVSTAWVSGALGSRAPPSA